MDRKQLTQITFQIIMDIEAVGTKSMALSVARHVARTILEFTDLAEVDSKRGSSGVVATEDVDAELVQMIALGVSRSTIVFGDDSLVQLQQLLVPALHDVCDVRLKDLPPVPDGHPSRYFVPSVSYKRGHTPHWIQVFKAINEPSAWVGGRALSWDFETITVSMHQGTVVFACEFAHRLNKVAPMGNGNGFSIMVCEKWGLIEAGGTMFSIRRADHAED